MKKMLATIMGVAFATSAMAQYLIYDYKVNFKRVDAQYTKVSYTLDEYDGKFVKGQDPTLYMDSFKTASDKLAGYVLVPVCKECNPAGWEDFGTHAFTPADAPIVTGTDAASGEPTTVDTDSFILDMNLAYKDVEWPAVAYITRNGDKIGSNPFLKEAGAPELAGKKLVWELNVNVDAAAFSKGVGARIPYNDKCFLFNDALASKPTSLKALKEAWLVMSYDVVDSWNQIEKNAEIYFYPPVKGMAITDKLPCPTEKTTYGFVGYQSRGGSVSHAGFGKLSSYYKPGTTDIGFCGSVSTDAEKCRSVSSISGSIVGLFDYKGFCTNPPMFDICSLAIVEVAPISGTFTLKLNNSASKKYGASLNAAKAYVLEDKYGFDANNESKKYSLVKGN